MNRLPRRAVIVCGLLAVLAIAVGCRPRGIAFKPRPMAPVRAVSTRTAAAKSKAPKKKNAEDPALAKGLAALDKEDYDQAVTQFTQVIRRDGRNADAYYYRGLAHCYNDDLDKARADANKAITLDPKHDGAYTLRGWLHLDEEEYDKAIADCTKAISIDPKSADAFSVRAAAYDEMKRFDKAVADYAQACTLEPGEADYHNALAWILATCPEARHRNGAKAVDHATRACSLTGHKEAIHLDTLAAAYAESGKFKEAVEWQQKAIAAAVDPDDREDFQERLRLYRAGKPYHTE